MIMMTKAYHIFLGFSWHILFADVAVTDITFQVIFTYDIFFGRSFMFAIIATFIYIGTTYV